MLVSAYLLLWAWTFHLLSKVCFFLAEAYVCLVEGFILKPLGYRPIMVFRKEDGLIEQRKQEYHAAGISDIKHLHSTMANLSEQVQQLQSCTSSPTHQEHVQTWFQNHAAAFDVAHSECSSTSLIPTHPAIQHTWSTACHLQVQPAACAAAAAAIAVFGQAGLPANATAAAVGTAAALAKQLSSSSDSTVQEVSSRRVSSCCTVPPLEYDVSAEEQRELEDCAPAEFLCPLGRVLMTDPVCTPSGFTYQRSLIEDFLFKTGHDPARDTPLAIHQLYPNIVLRDQIATWLQKRGIPT